MIRKAKEAKEAAEAAVLAAKVETHDDQMAQRLNQIVDEQIMGDLAANTGSLTKERFREACTLPLKE